MAKKKKVEIEAKACINLSVIRCWNCKHDMIDAYYSNDISIPVGPSYFTEKQMKIALDDGCIIKETFSNTVQESYPAALCPNCGSMHGDFFYHDYAYVPGDVQYFLDNDDNVIDKIINKELILKPLKEEEIILEEANKSERFPKRESLGKCIKVRFKNINKTYKYNCKFEVNIGDSVTVFGKLEDDIGEVVEIVGQWQFSKFMQEIKSVIKLD